VGGIDLIHDRANPGPRLRRLPARGDNPLNVCEAGTICSMWRVL
jgi:hypothetical protein